MWKLCGVDTDTHFIDEDPRKQSSIDGMKVTEQIWQWPKKKVPNWIFVSNALFSLLFLLVSAALNFLEKCFFIMFSVFFFFPTLEDMTKT